MALRKARFATVGSALRALRICLVPVVMAALLFGCSPDGVERVEWTTMDTVAAVQVKNGTLSGESHAVTTVKESFAKVERLLNAFDPSSELSRLARLPDAEVLAKCDPLVRPCYAAAFRLRDETGGVFNPRWRGPGTLDLGAIAKGFAVDLAASALAKEGVRGDVLVDLGGNLKSVRGTWTTGVSDPARPDDTAETFELVSGSACATSARYFRGDHIRNGRDGSAMKAACRSVTVVHPNSAMLADGLSTVLFLLGRDKGERFLREHYPVARATWIE